MGLATLLTITRDQSTVFLEVNDVNRLKELEEENVKLKKVFAAVSHENHAMKKLFSKTVGRGGEEILY